MSPALSQSAAGSQGTASIIARTHLGDRQLLLHALQLSSSHLQAGKRLAALRTRLGLGGASTSSGSLQRRGWWCVVRRRAEGSVRPANNMCVGGAQAGAHTP